ncbi:MAG: PilZ domain-containing protein [Myxococcota bacterium]
MSVSVERRRSSRIDKVFRVLISTEEFGDQWFVARNISTTGMFVEMAEPLPLRTKVIVRFALTGPTPEGLEPGTEGAITAMAKVQNHYYLQYADKDGLRALCGVGLRFLRFLPEAHLTPPAHALH